MILDVCGALAPILLSDDRITRVVLDIEPLTWEPERLYVYPMRVDEVPFETSSGRRQEFDLNAVYVTDNGGEEAQQVRDPALAARLDAIRGQMFAAVRANQTLVGGMLRALTDDTSPRTLDKRSASVRINGWRIVGGS
jgi:hypothetical protein